MKRAHDDISPPANGDGPTKVPAGVAAGNGVVKGAEPTSPAEQSSAATAAAAPAPAATAAASSSGQQRKKCPYLDTINRNVLDFDFEKVRIILQLVHVLFAVLFMLLSSVANQHEIAEAAAARSLGCEERRASAPAPGD